MLVEELLDNVKSGYRASIIVNTVEVIEYIYLRLKDKEKVICFIAGSTPKNRLEKLQYLKKYWDILLVSTQVLDAGVGISFDVMISQILPLSS
ncbi:MAG: hypothetical protein RQ885_02960 [Desulfurococcales archaeon]|jgi:CRISPR/Cas system-associated endonuclease/helicase Cas3|nr:hypothetical protein [Desulfurococcales archaeon]